MRAGVGVYFYNAPITSHPGGETLGTNMYASKAWDLVRFVGNFLSRMGAELFLKEPRKIPEGFLSPTELLFLGTPGGAD